MADGVSASSLWAHLRPRYVLEDYVYTVLARRNRSLNVSSRFAVDGMLQVRESRLKMADVVSASSLSAHLLGLLLILRNQLQYGAERQRECYVCIEKSCL